MFRILNTIIPKHTKQICIHSWPDYDDMTRGLLNELEIKNNSYQVSILTHQNRKPPTWACKPYVTHVKKTSIRGLWTYLRSKYVFFTHGCFSSFKPVKTQISVNIWHGMPIKNIGRYLGPNHPTKHSTYAVSTSPFFTEIISHAFEIPRERILEVGLPRNDLLSNEKNISLRQQICHTQKMVIWLPTYRQAITGDIRIDGQIEKNVFNLPDLNIRELNNSLKEIGAVAVLKPHPMAPRAEKDLIRRNLSHIKLIDEEWLLRQQTTLYEILSLSDLLITDISSVLIDYLILNKPMVCHFPDVDVYKNSRGMIWDFDPIKYGIPVAYNQSDIVMTLAKALRSEGREHRYSTLKDMMHSSYSGFSASLFDSLGL